MSSECDDESDAVYNAVARPHAGIHVDDPPANLRLYFTLIPPAPGAPAGSELHGDAPTQAYDLSSQFAPPEPAASSTPTTTTTTTLYHPFPATTTNTRLLPHP